MVKCFIVTIIAIIIYEFTYQKTIKPLRHRARLSMDMSQDMLHSNEAQARKLRTKSIQYILLSVFLQLSGYTMLILCGQYAAYVFKGRI